ncbi:MAG: zeta toxin family protein [Candidatus Kapabacteria bacterium]|nr:zeta toxin family protein [Candidatus Kapabacteria bacterium]
MWAPFIIVIAGPNGVGKTTFAQRYLKTIPECEEFVNADEIALSLENLPHGERNLRAGRIAIERMDELVKQRKSFAFESTLSGKSLAVRLTRAREKGYRIILLFLWVPSVEETLKRIHRRSELGGHDVPVSDVMRRHDRCYHNFHELYKGICNEWTIYDASFYNPRPVQQGYTDGSQR